MSECVCLCVCLSTVCTCVASLRVCVPFPPPPIPGQHANHNTHRIIAQAQTAAARAAAEDLTGMVGGLMQVRACVYVCEARGQKGGRICVCVHPRAHTPLYTRTRKHTHPALTPLHTYTHMHTYTRLRTQEWGAVLREVTYLEGKQAVIEVGATHDACTRMHACFCAVYS